MNASNVRAILARHGLSANRDLGQSFLVDDAMAEKLVRLAGVEPGETVIEIGAGLGTLTLALAARATRVIAIEIDAGLVRALRAERVLPDNVELLHADALTLDLAGLARGRVRVVANLPYSVASPLLRRLLDLRAELLDWSVMLQREVAERVVAAPGSRAYGSLAVLHALTVDAVRCAELAPALFYPPPRVHSTFLRVTPKKVESLAVGELAGVERIVRAAFSKRRKTLANALKGSGVAPPPAALAALFERLAIDPRARAESLAPDRLAELARALMAAGVGAAGAAPWS